MKVGDLVSYLRLHYVKGLSPVGVVVRTPEETLNGDFEVLFGDRVRFCRGKLLEIVSEVSK